MSKEIIAKKAAIVEEVVEKFEKASSVVVVDYRGLTVEEVTNLRKELREAGVEMRVIKNTYLKRAADKAGYEGLDETFSGPTAVAFADEDVTAPARILSKFAEDHEALEIKVMTWVWQTSTENSAVWPLWPPWRRSVTA